jgi:hypothetical protein
MNWTMNAPSGNGTIWSDDPDNFGVSITVDTLVIVEYSYTPYEPFLLPIMFVIGMVGLGAMFIGLLYGGHKIQHHEYRAGFIYGVILFFTGLALLISWLWSAMG